MDVTLLALRLGLGGMLITHGINKISGPGGLAGTTSWFESLGFRPPWLHARLAAFTEIGAGTLMVLGLLIPFASAAFVALMTVAGRTDHSGKGFFVFKGGWEYVGLVGLVAVCIAAMGPGGWSIDAALDWHLNGLIWAIVAFGFGVISAMALLLAGRTKTMPVST
ncbi:DoxX family protein [Rhodococcus sp. WAY2]|uniref:DoxX family protein n=1 Tax=Rhodococcus sp. WAY2 TaxID=2663121 RepID=UPI001F1B4B30|nr:DoxX family protein [Rhodococcus sp. WAY2]